MITLEYQAGNVGFYDDGILLPTGHDIKEIWYVDTEERKSYRYRQSHQAKSNKE